MSENNSNITNNGNNTGNGGDFSSDKEENINLSGENISKESNYEISLVDENLLRIKISTLKAVNINCTIKDPSIPDNKTDELNTNNIRINPKTDGTIQEIEILISLTDYKKQLRKADEIGKPGVLTPNPEVAYLIQKVPEKPEPHVKTEDDILFEKLVSRNPYLIYRKLLQRNTINGMIISLILTFFLTFVFHSMIHKNPEENDEVQRLIVLQDISDPEKKDPNEQVKPPIEPPKTNYADEIKKKVETSKSVDPVKTIKRKETPPLDTAKMNAYRRKLDSLENIAKNMKNDEKDTTSGNNPGKNLSSDTTYAQYSEFRLNLINSDCKTFWDTTNYIPEPSSKGRDLILAFIHYVNKGSKDDQIQLWIYNKKYQYEKISGKFTPENKFDIGDPNYTAYRIIEDDNEIMRIFYYVKFKENVEFTYYSGMDKKFYDNTVQNFLDLTIKSLRVDEAKK